VAPAYLRALSRQFSISAPRMAVRTNLAWPWKAGLAIVLVATIGGMWWWGFDFGQFGGSDQRHQEQRIATLAADMATAQREAVELRTRNTQLESDLAMMRGMQATLQKQQAEALHENAQLKDELSFFQQFFADSTKAPGVGIQRIALDGNGTDIVRYSVLIVRGGSTKTDFDGQVALQAELVPLKESEPGTKPLTVSLPGDAPEAALKLKFKYYQRVEGTIRLPPGYQVRTLTARAYESGSSAPRATRTLTLP
jgi:nitrogen fixation-related uncharacterized protein